jgi:cation diffusion facilitator family transporter
MSKPAAVPAPLSPASPVGARVLRPELAAHGERAVALTRHEQRQADRVLVVLVIMSAFFAAQIAGATWADSDVLRAEALHLLTDVAALGLSYLAIRVAIRRPTARFTYGLRRAEPVAAVFNALLVLGATALVVAEAIGDLSRGAGPRADRMLVIAFVGLLVNGVAAWLIHGAIGAHAGDDHDHDHDHDRDHDHDHDHGCADLSHQHLAQQVRRRGHGHVLNLRGAWLHLFGDALGSLAALVAAVAIRAGASPRVDPIASFVVAAILVYGGVRLLKDAVLILLEASPSHLSVSEVRKTVLATAGIAELHDLHVWTLGAGHDAITAHVSASAPDAALAARVEDALRHRFHVEYVTIQVEVGGVTCQSEEEGAEGLRGQGAKGRPSN